MERRPALERRPSGGAARRRCAVAQGPEEEGLREGRRSELRRGPRGERPGGGRLRWGATARARGAWSGRRRGAGACLTGSGLDRSGSQGEGSSRDLGEGWRPKLGLAAWGWGMNKIRYLFLCPVLYSYHIKKESYYLKILNKIYL